MKYIFSLIILSLLSPQLYSQEINEAELVEKDRFRVKSERRLKKQLSKLEVFKNSYSGLCVYDVSKEKYVVEYNSDKYFTPASNTKLFTYYAGLKNIGDKLPSLYYTEKEDSLIIWGSGAPTLLQEQLNDSVTFQFLKNSKDTIYFSNSNNLIDRFGDGWSWNDYSYYYSKEVHPFPVYSSAVKLTLYPNGHFTVNPKQFRDSIEVMDYSKRFSLIREEKSNKFKFYPKQSEDTLSTETPFINNTQLHLKLLSDSLNKTIIVIDREMGESENINTFYGIESDSLYKPFLQESDNYFAESIILMSANKFGLEDSLNTLNIMDTLYNRDYNFITQKPRWVDGSGLSRYNLFTPQSMVELLLEIRNEHLSKHGNMDVIFELLPTGGQTGTIRKRFTNHPPYVYAKTGTLGNNHNLSGYLVTKSGKLLVFSFMNNHYKFKTSTIQSQTDEILEDFYLKY